MSHEVSRRSFFVDCMSWAAKAWIVLGASSLVAACGDTLSKYGGPPEDLSTPTDMPVVKYGGPPDQSTPDDMPVVKYGGPPDMAVPDDMPVVKYGGPPDLSAFG